MKRYVVRQEIYDGFCNWCTDIYIDDHSNIRDAVIDILRRKRANEVIGDVAEFFIYDRKENKVIPPEEFKDVL